MERQDDVDPDQLLCSLFGLPEVPAPPSPASSSSSSDSESEVDEGLFQELEAMLAEPEPKEAETLEISTELDEEVSGPINKESYAPPPSSPPSNPIQYRLHQLRQNRKKAEQNRVRRMQESIVNEELKAELDVMTRMFCDMKRMMAQREREDRIAQTSQFTYFRQVENTTELMHEFEHYFHILSIVNNKCKIFFLFFKIIQLQFQTFLGLHDFLHDTLRHGFTSG